MWKTTFLKIGTKKDIWFHLISSKTEGVAQRCSVEKVLLEILQNSLENALSIGLSLQLY